MSEYTNIPCLDVPGNTIRIYVYKPQGRPAYACATEGRFKKGTNGGLDSFEMELYGKDRTHRVQLVGNNTPKNRSVALQLLLADLKNAGWVSRDATI